MSAKILFALNMAADLRETEHGVDIVGGQDRWETVPMKKQGSRDDVWADCWWAGSLSTVPMKSNEAENMVGPIAGGHDLLGTVTRKSNECLGPQARPQTPHRIRWLRLMRFPKASAMKS